MKSKCFVDSCNKEVEHYEIMTLPNGEKHALFKCLGPRNLIDDAVLWSVVLEEDLE